VTRRALFLDRDGTLMIDTGYARDPASVELLPGVAAGLVEARALGFELVVISNQSGVARGIISPEQLASVQARLEELLRSEGVALDDVRFCVHHPDDGCRCRKPAAGMLEDAAMARGIDLERSVMIGDRDSDVLAGRNAGCMTILVGGVSKSADYLASSFTDIPAILRQIIGAGTKT
jgi:D-glycero-D-manno-heptose 1,7-bisphosphate phosphatase